MMRKRRAAVASSSGTGGGGFTLPFEVWVKAPTDVEPWLWVGTHIEGDAEEDRAEVVAAHPDWHVELRTRDDD
jgi:hypothetical protein